MSSAPKPRYSEQDEGLRLEEQIRSLLAEGQIWEAQKLFNTSGDLLPAESKLREILAPPRIRKSNVRDVDRSPEFHWISTCGEEYQGKWVALVGDNLVASSDSLKELLAELKQRKFERVPLIHHLIQMLVLNGEFFTSGRSQFLDSHPRFLEPTAKIFVKVEFPGLEKRFLAQIDTGAAYSMLEAQIAEELELFGQEGYIARISTRIGTFSGRLVRIPLTLVADAGASLDVEGTFFVSREWRGPTFLGYVGLLDRLRIALDAPANLFYFGEGG